MLTFGSLFAGIGGFDLGLERAGMVCKWQVEINPFCQKVLAKHWPNVQRYEDVRECGKHNLEAVDLIAGGFPCQPHSVAGKQRGAEDDRNLWPEYRRIVAELRPTWLLAEHVPGIRRTILDQVLSELESFGYACEAFIIPAISQNAPHRRDRVWIVGNRDRINGNTVQSVQERGSVKIDIWGRSIQTIDLDSLKEWEMAHGRVFGVDDGISVSMDRVRSLGNAIVPQVVVPIMQAIKELS